MSIKQGDKVLWDLAEIKAAKKHLQNSSNEVYAYLINLLNAMESQQLNSRKELNTKQYIQTKFNHCLKVANINTGTVAEIGGPFNTFLINDKDAFAMEWLSLYPVKDNEAVKV